MFASINMYFWRSWTNKISWTDWLRAISKLWGGGRKKKETIDDLDSDLKQVKCIPPQWAWLQSFTWLSAVYRCLSQTHRLPEHEKTTAIYRCIKILDGSQTAEPIRCLLRRVQQCYDLAKLLKRTTNCILRQQEELTVCKTRITDSFTEGGGAGTVWKGALPDPLFGKNREHLIKQGRLSFSLQSLCLCAVLLHVPWCRITASPK